MKPARPPTAEELESRVLMMLAALERAGVSPVQIGQLHAFAYFANVLSPLWSLDPLQGSVLKRRDGPYFDEIQKAVDQLIGIGAVEVVTLSYKQVPDGARLTATIRIRLKQAEPVLQVLRMLPDEVANAGFLNELGFVFAEIEPLRTDETVSVDATYNAPTTTENRVIDFAEWKKPTEADYSVIAARRLQKYAPSKVTLSNAEELVLYMRLLKQRAIANAG